MSGLLSWIKCGTIGELKRPTIDDDLKQPGGGVKREAGKPVSVLFPREDGNELDLSINSGGGETLWGWRCILKIDFLVNIMWNISERIKTRTFLGYWNVPLVFLLQAWITQQILLMLVRNVSTSLIPPMTDCSLKNFIFFLHSIKMFIMYGKTILMKILHKDNQKETFQFMKIWKEINTMFSCRCLRRRKGSRLWWKLRYSWKCLYHEHHWTVSQVAL